MTVPVVLVLGATSKIGGPLINLLLPDHAAGHLKLIAATRQPDASRLFERLGIETRHIDLDRPPLDGLGALTNSFRGVDRLFLLTGYDVKMLAQSKAAVDAAVAAGVSHLVHVGAYASPDTTIVHLGWHQLIEAYIERSRLGWTHLHPNSFMQNLVMLTAMGSAGPGVITHYIGDARTSWIDAEDVAAVAASVLRAPQSHAGKAYPLATEAASVAEIASLMTEITGLPWRYNSQNAEMFFRTVTAAGAEPNYMACVKNVFDRIRDGSLAEAADTFDTVERLTGRPPTSLRRFIEKHRTSFRVDELVTTLAD